MSEVIKAMFDDIADISNLSADEWPYGMYITKSGETYLFNRSYNPLWKMGNDQRVQRVKKGFWVPDVIAHQFFYNDWFHPRKDKISRDRILSILKFWLDSRIHVVEFNQIKYGKNNDD